MFYGWVLVGAAFINQAFTAALLQRSYGSYVVFLRSEFGWSKAALAGAYSLQQLETGILGPVQGWLIDRFGPRISMRIGVVMFGLGFMAFSQVHSLLMFYLAYMFLAVGSSLGGFFPWNVVVVNWFTKRRARALSTLQMGGAVGGFLIFIVAFSLETFGWRTTAFASGILTMAVGLPLIQLVRHRPEDYGLAVDGVDPSETSDGSAVSKSALADHSNDFTVREALRTPAFWLISLGHGSALLIVGAVNVHLVLHITDGLGYSLQLASLTISLITIGQLGGMFIGGAIGDKFDKRLIAVGCMAFHSLALILLANAVNLAMVFTFATMHGVAWGLRGPMMQAIRADYFGTRSYGQIMGTSSLVVQVGSISGPILAGILADRTGSYAVGFNILAVLSGLGSVFFLLARRPVLKRRAQVAVAEVVAP